MISLVLTFSNIRNHQKYQIQLTIKYMAWFRRKDPKIGDQSNEEERKVKTEGIFVKCAGMLRTAL